jgi:hypothetical protein
MNYETCAKLVGNCVFEPVFGGGKREYKGLSIGRRGRRVAEGGKSAKSQSLRGFILF